MRMLLDTPFVVHLIPFFIELSGQYFLERRSPSVLMRIKHTLLRTGNCALRRVCPRKAPKVTRLVSTLSDVSSPDARCGQDGPCVAEVYLFQLDQAKQFGEGMGSCRARPVDEPWDAVENTLRLQDVEQSRRRWQSHAGKS